MLVARLAQQVSMITYSLVNLLIRLILLLSFPTVISTRHNDYGATFRAIKLS
jgi:hypothetical protein